MSIKIVLSDLNEVLSLKFPTIKVVSHQINEPIIRPSFVPMVSSNITIEPIGTLRRSYVVPIDLIYFSTKSGHNKIENIEMIESLRKLLDIRLNGYKYEIRDPLYEIVDDVLHYTFSLAWFDYVEEDPSIPLMQNLITRKI